MLVGDSFPEYVFTRIAIFALRLIAPVSLVYSSVFIVIRSVSLLKPPGLVPLHIWMFAEFAFFIGVYLPLKFILSKPATHPEALPTQDRKALIGKTFQHVPNVDHYLSKWFLNSPPSEIKRENVRRFYAWSLLDKEYENVDKDEETELNACIDSMEWNLGRRLSDGWGKAQSLRLTLQAVPMQHRPLIWYAIVFIVECYSDVRLLYNFFHFHGLPLKRSVMTFPPRLPPLFTRQACPSRRLSYWHRKHTSKTKAPVLFIHGIGIGIYACVDFLIDLNSEPHDDSYNGDIGIIAVEIMPISARICPPALSAVETKNEIRKILEAHGWDEFVLVGHSYGSGIAANILRDPEMSKYCKAAVLMDPISFMLHLPDVAYNFTRRKPTKASEHMLHYFSSQDMMISHTLARRFFWKEFILFKEDLPKNMPMTVTLSGKDIIVPTREVWEYLTGESMSTSDDEGSKEGVEWKDRDLKVLWFGALNHAGLFNTKGVRRGIAKMVRKYSERGSAVEGYVLVNTD